MYDFCETTSTTVLLPSCYYIAGAAAGLFEGTKYAATLLWMTLAHDEIHIRLMQGSPMKYQPIDFKMGHGNVHGHELRY
ncbi:hypothetical protein H632_c30p3 [Helicosporidium sp. ATCC 50920]|nr:hypothetical protein H632_c30p3 [Helicosporidium sp. ATCC 50920]|eukprot:KDD77058.1 hypothetical protein H632_c30p3 [Helicosporidium sp. ATCC 50920]